MKYSKELIKKLKKHIRQNSSKYLEASNISSVGIGIKFKDGKRTDEICLQFSVDEKIELESLESLDTFIIPKSIIIDGMEIQTDVVERKYKLSFETIEAVSNNNRKVRLDPIIPGISICNSKGTAGTLGCIVYDKNDETPYILSNWHVLHGENGKIGDIIVQPGPHDDNRILENKTGTLIRSHLGIAGDCAISSIEGRGFNEEIFNIGTKVEELCEPELFDKVIKSGRTTDVTFGMVQRIHIINKINYGLKTGNRTIGCFEIGIDDDNIPESDEITKGGDSGSCWMISKDNKATNILAGLHFAGEGTHNPNEFALACYSKPIFEKLAIKPSKGKKIIKKKASGYDCNFLNTAITIPKLNDDSIAYNLNNSTCVDYTHFSLALHKKRKFAIWVAWNINGSKMKRINRNGLHFKLDSRIPRKYQAGNALYKNNDLDRGHLARRVDLVWGNYDEAKKGNKDSFYYTNIAPQMDVFNQSRKGGVWGELENTIFENVNLDKLKISVFAGPIFQENDKEYRSFKIPKEFYKILIYEVAGKLKSKTFLLTQNITSIELFGFEEFETYEITLTELAEKCNFSLDAKLLESENNSAIESIEKKQPIKNIKAINWLY